MVKQTQSTLVLHADGTEEHLPRKLTLEELRQLVGGYVEVVSVMYEDKRTQLIVNEDGHPLRLPYNRHATELYFAIGGTTPVVGDCALLLNWKLD